jgi:hypothetical protein
MRLTHATACLLFLTLSACGDSTPPEKKELIKRLNDSRDQPPEARINIYCGDRASKLCDKLRTDPGYRDTWLQTMDKLADSQSAVDRTVDRIQKERAAAQRKLDEYIAAAPKLPDGTPVFVDKDGTYRDDKGNVIPPELARTAR